MIPLAFHEGTALRFLYSHSRYSEDLDFVLERPSASYDFCRYLQAIRADLAPQGYAVELKINDHKTVHDAFVQFSGLPYDLGFSPHRNEVLAVKVEVDTRPPAGAVLETTVIRRPIMLHLQHHDRASLLAGKLHAILHRPFLKGRDLYDLLWYLSDPAWPPPNLVMLNNALQQTGWDRSVLSEADWRQAVKQRLTDVNWPRANADMRPFLEPGSDIGLLNLENLTRLLS